MSMEPGQPSRQHAHAKGKRPAFGGPLTFLSWSYRVAADFLRVVDLRPLDLRAAVFRRLVAFLRVALARLVAFLRVALARVVAFLRVALARALRVGFFAAPRARVDAFFPVVGARFTTFLVSAGAVPTISPAGSATRSTGSQVRSGGGSADGAGGGAGCAGVSGAPPHGEV